MTVFELIQIGGFIGALLFGWRVLSQVTSKVDNLVESFDAGRVELAKLRTILDIRVAQIDDHEDRLRDLEDE